MQTQRRAMGVWALALMLGAVIPCGQCAGAVIYVDNRIGSDAADGASEELVDLRSGPVRTIRRALQLARRGDTISIANHGVPYYESIALTGARHCGYSQRKFTIIGNGAVVSGAQPVPPAAWKEVESDLWKFTPWRKGHYRLILDGKAVPEVAAPYEESTGASDSLPDVPEGQWAAWRGSIYYRTPRFERPAERPFAFAAQGVGLTLADVHDVHVVGLVFRHFRLDGVSAHSRARGIVLDNVQSLENGRAGLFVGGTSDVEALDCRFERNRKANVLLRGDYAVTRTVPELPEPPTFID